jgi:hypothetical protein
MAELANVFSWSRSRGAMFEECRRRYYYHYYGAWGGWDSNAPDDARRLYVLKQLTGRQGWAGRVVHEAVEMALRVLHSGRDLPEAWLLDETLRRMRQEWRASRSGAYRTTPRGGVALFEHEYGIPVSDRTWQVLRDHVLRCLRTFQRLPLFREIRDTPRERWILLEDIRAFHFEGTPVYAAPDFGFWTPADRLALVDWKTGSPAPEETAVQLGCYGLYAAEILDVEPARVDLLEVNLREGAVTTHAWDASRIEDIRERLRLSIRGMRTWLRDPDANVAVLDDFERTEDRRICRWCNFRVVCRPELDLSEPPSHPQPPPQPSDGLRPLAGGEGVGRLD